MPDGSEGALSDFLRTVAASSIGFVIMRIVTGWLEARFSKGRFLETEKDADCKRAESLIDDLVNNGCNYWSSDLVNILPTLQYQIPPDLNELGAIFETLFKDDPVLLRDLQTSLNRLDQAITGLEFGSVSRPQRLEKITEIRNMAGSLRTTLRSHRRKLSPNWFA